MERNHSINNTQERRKVREGGRENQSKQVREISKRSGESGSQEGEQSRVHARYVGGVREFI